MNKLKETLANKEPYEIVELTDEVMVIDLDDMPGRHERYRARAKFVDSIKYNFPVQNCLYMQNWQANSVELTIW